MQVKLVLRVNKHHMLHYWKVQNHVDAIPKNPSVYAIVHNLCVQLQLSVHSSITRTLINYTINWCSHLHCATKTLPKPASNSCYLNRTIISEPESILQSTLAKLFLCKLCLIKINTLQDKNSQLETILLLFASTGGEPRKHTEAN